jgi:hypothetical protein
MLDSHRSVGTPAAQFPFPAWATRLSEPAGGPAPLASTNGAARRDPFARLPAAPPDDEDDAPF